MDMEITSKSSTDMRKIKAEYLKDHEEKRVKGTVSKDFPIDLTWRVHAAIRNQHTITIAPQVQVTLVMLYRIKKPCSVGRSSDSCPRNLYLRNDPD